MANLRVDKITSTETFETTGSVQFDGDADYLEASNSDDFQLGTGDFTVEAWVLANDNNGSRQIISMSDGCLLYTSPSPRDQRGSRMPSSA